ncbi:MAG: DUF6502 family protein [Bdellovibrionota bacterium]|nr:MAG: DUF6502 family protein [Bdellovibrionota bacterium]
MRTSENTILLLRMVLKPLLRVCMRSQCTFQSIVDVVKVAFVEAAVEEIERTSTKVNVSRISVLTGLHRKDVTKIFRAGKTVLRSTEPLMTRIIGQWEQDRRFCGKSGRPRVLSCTGDDSEFSRLVRSVTDDVSPGTVLFELERSGVAVRTAHGLKLSRRTMPTKANERDKVELLGRDIGSMLQACDENLSGPPSPPHAHLRTEYDNVRVSDIPALRAFINRSSEAFHKRIRSFIAKHDLDIRPARNGEEVQGGGRVVVTTFSHTEEGPN